MGHDYSYSQPSSSDNSLTWLLEEEAQLYKEEAQLYKDEAESSYNPEPIEDGIPRTCYCGNEAIVATSYSGSHPGRRFFTCQNVEDGECHIWKWWDVGVMEEMREFDRQLKDVKDQGKQTEQKVAKVDEKVSEIAKKNSSGIKLVVCVMALTVFLCLVMVVVFNRVPEKDNRIRECLEEIVSLKVQVSELKKVALQLFYNDNGIKFNLEHAWRELRYDNKWCSTCLPKETVKEKRKGQLEVDGEQDVGEQEPRPMGVKAAKAATKKKKSGKEEELAMLQGLLEIKQKISNQKLLDRLLAKKEPLSEMETSLKLKLMSEML